MYLWGAQFRQGLQFAIDRIAHREIMNTYPQGE